MPTWIALQVMGFLLVYAGLALWLDRVAALLWFGIRRLHRFEMFFTKRRWF